MSRVKLYFEKNYSPDKKVVGIQLQGINENERADAIKNAFGNCDNKSLLDIGCGNGLVLKNALTGTPSLIRLEDIVKNNALLAEKKLRAHTKKVEAISADIFEQHNHEKYDNVIILGVTDYYQDWNKILETGLERTRGRLIIDFPKSNNFRVYLRKIWLKIHGINLRTIKKSSLINFLDSNTKHGHYTIDETTYNWVAVINININN